jgi:hypothetical protein
MTMPTLSETDLLRSLVSAEKAGREALEDQLAAATRMHAASVEVVRNVLTGAGASMEEALRASVAMGNVTRILRPQPKDTEERIPGRVVDLGVRLKRHAHSFYEGLELPGKKP